MIRRWEGGEAARSMKPQGMTGREGGGADDNDKDNFQNHPSSPSRSHERERRQPKERQSC